MTPPYKPNIPDVEKVKSAITNFKSRDWSKLDPANVDLYVNDLDQYFIENIGFIFRTLRISNSNKLPNTVYRVRKYEPGINATLISEFSNPPASLCKNIQRANLPNHPVFYCAPSAHTALAETLKYTYREGEQNLYFISEWNFRPDQNAYVTPFFYGAYNKVPAYNTLAEKALEDFKKKLPGISPEEEKSLQEIFSLFSSLFEEEGNHAISSYLAHIHLYTSSNIRTDVLIYPSIVTRKVSMNFAIHPNAVLHKLLLKRVFLTGIDYYNFNVDRSEMKVHFDIQDKLGINNDHGYLTWRELPDKDLNDFKMLFPPAAIPDQD